MTCPSAQVLSQYFDELLVGEEQRQIMRHVTSCAACQCVLALYEDEAKFIKETLRMPSLRADFVDEVLAQVKSRHERRWLKYSYVAMLALIALFITTLICAEVVM